MGEIADDCQGRALSDYYEMDESQRVNFEIDWAYQQQLLERRAQWRRNNRRTSVTTDFNKEPPF